MTKAYYYRVVHYGFFIPNRYIENVLLIFRFLDGFIRFVFESVDSNSESVSSVSTTVSSESDSSELELETTGNYSYFLKFSLLQAPKMQTNNSLLSLFALEFKFVVFLSVEHINKELLL